MASIKALVAGVSALAVCIGSADAACKITNTGSSPDSLLLKGTVLTPDGPLANGRVLVRSGKISYVGTSCGLGRLETNDTTVVECTGSVISPGFINAHEHISYSTITPLEDIGERASQRHDWRVGARNHTERPAPVNGSSEDATAWGELRHLLSGTTSIVGGDMAPGLTRNLDFVAGLEDGMHLPVATWDVFPLNDAAGIQRSGDCDYGPNATDTEEAGKLYRYMAHVAEGVDAVAENEFKCLSDQTYDTTAMPGGGGLSTDIIAPNLVLVHGLGLTEADFDLVAERGAKVVWSPRSNVFLYGRTLNVTYLLEAGITVALGTDWLPSGSATMAREAVCGASAMKEIYDMKIEPKTLWEMMTINAAEAVGFEASLGSLEKGKMADIVIFGGGGDDAYAQAVFSSGEDVELVMRGGTIFLAGEDLKELATGDCEPVAFGDVVNTVCVKDELGMTFADFEASLQGVYPAIYAGIPDQEPTCEPVL